jgi:hypothetical protein
MINKIDKYRSRYAWVILASYLVLVGLTIFHYHHVNIENGCYKIVNDGGSETNPFDRIIDLTHECTVQQFANTVIIYNFSGIFNLINNKVEQNFSFDKTLYFQTPLLYNSNPHRAPPNFI